MRYNQTKTEMKKLLLLIATCCLSLQSHAQYFEANYKDKKISYEITSNAKPYTVGVTSHGFDKYAGNVEIPASVIYEKIKYSVTSIEEEAFSECNNLTSITIPNTVTTIGVKAFHKCSSLTSIKIPNSVTIIESRAFSRCSSLTSFFVGNKNISFETMDNGRFLIKKIGDEKVLIGFASFEMTSANIPFSVTSISDNTFLYCYELQNITIPNTVTSIGLRAFFGCEGLSSVTIPNSITNIGPGAFNGCIGISSITIPNSVKSIGSETFSGCKNLKSIIMSDSLTCIGDWAFYGCSRLEAITIPNTVTSIGNYAFNECEALKTITIPNSVKSIGESAFLLCKKMISFVVDSKNKMFETMGNNRFLIKKDGNEKVLIAFAPSGMVSAKIPDSITNICDYSFKNCSELETVTIPNSVSDIKGNAFLYCEHLKSFVVDSKNKLFETLNNNRFLIKKEDKKKALIAFAPFEMVSAKIPESITSIGDHVFKGCVNLTAVTIPDSVIEIDDYAFADCEGLTSITIPKSIIKIGDGAFADCKGLKSITSLPATPPKIEGKFTFLKIKSNIPLYVPSGSLSTYKNANGWKFFKKISEK